MEINKSGLRLAVANLGLTLLELMSAKKVCISGGKRFVARDLRVRIFLEPRSRTSIHILILVSLQNYYKYTIIKQYEPYTAVQYIGSPFGNRES